MNNIRKRDGVILLDIEGIYLLACNKDARNFCPYVQQVNEIGAFIWNQLDLVSNIDEVLERISDEYDIVDHDLLARDVQIFISTLKDKSYLI